MILWARLQTTDSTLNLIAINHLDQITHDDKIFNVLHDQKLNNECLLSNFQCSITV